MRAYELEESAVEELKNRLPKLKRHNYDTIDRLMQNISIKHKITGKKLHDMFVKKYGHTPDTWIKKIKNKLGEEGVAEGSLEEYGDTAKGQKMLTKVQKRAVDRAIKADDKRDPKAAKKNADTADRAWERMTDKDVAEGTILPLKRPMSKVQHGKRTFPPTQRNVTEPEGNVTPIQKKSNQNQIGEEVTSSTDVQKIKDFIKWSQKTLNIQKPYPKITLSKNTEKAQQGHHTGVHKGNDIWVYIGNRNLIDIFRTIFHELTHHRQMQLGMIEDGDSYPGSPIEMLADMAAGKYIKIYGKEHPEIFQ